MTYPNIERQRVVELSKRVWELLHPYEKLCPTDTWILREISSMNKNELWVLEISLTRKSGRMERVMNA
jgi:hypothetical protein